jgi:protocatechuate 3,4-dioxygenase beta subunit
VLETKSHSAVYIDDVAGPLLTRRAALQVGGSVLLAGVGLRATRSGAAPLLASCKKTPFDRGNPPPTPPGRPYFDPHSPERQNLREPRMRGVLLTLRGRVLDENCKPVAAAIVDFFHCDSRGRYDRKEIRLHGHQFTDARGRYVLRTIVPNHYLTRAPHIHVAVQAAHGPVLATQLFFPATLRAYGMRVGALNRRDRGFNPATMVQLGPRRRNSYSATFDFVIST